MKLTTLGLVISVAGMLTASSVLAHGFGGATGHPGGAEAGHHGGSNATARPSEPSSAYHPNGSTGNYHPPSESTYPNASAYHAGSEPYSATASGYHPQSAAAYPAAHAYQPTDAGFNTANAGAAASQYAARNGAQTNTSLPNQGAAVRSAYNGAGTFNQDWYGAHPDAWAATGWPAGYAWNAGTWAAVAPAMGVAAVAQPISYDYGYAGAVAQTDQSVPTAQSNTSGTQSYQQSATLAQSVPPTSSQSSDWTPLGVFALVHDPESTPHYVMQLAVNKSGTLAGNYVDLVTDTVKPVQGGVDKQSQRVAWTVGSNTSTVGEAGLYNLTQDQAPALIHLGPDKTQQWLLVRLKKSQ